MKAKEKLEELLGSEGIEGITTSYVGNQNYSVTFIEEGQEFCICVLEYKPSLTDVMDLISNNTERGITTGFILVRPRYPSFMTDKDVPTRFFKSAGAHKKPNLRARFNQDFDVLQRLVKTNNLERFLNFLSNPLIYFYEDCFQAIEFPFERVHPNAYREGEDKEYKLVTDYFATDLKSFTVKKTVLPSNELKSREIPIRNTNHILIATFDCIPLYQEGLEIAV